MTTIRGAETVWGEPGYCPHCHQDVPAGPDACIGLRPGIREACCGHGRPSAAYVTSTTGATLYGMDALQALGLPTWPMRMTA